MTVGRLPSQSFPINSRCASGLWRWTISKAATISRKPLCWGESPKIHEARDVLGARAAGKLLRIDTVLDERHTISGDPPKQAFVAGAAREDAVVAGERAARDRMEVGVL
jgi:hypothetical protein